MNYIANAEGTAKNTGLIGVDKMPSFANSGSCSRSSGQYAPLLLRQHFSPLDKIPWTKTTDVSPTGLRAHSPCILISWTYYNKNWNNGCIENCN